MVSGLLWSEQRRTMTVGVTTTNKTAREDTKMLYKATITTIKKAGDDSGQIGGQTKNGALTKKKYIRYKSKQGKSLKIPIYEYFWDTLNKTHL